MNLNKEKLTKSNILKYIDEFDIYNGYIQDNVTMSSNIISPLRPESKPSFGFFVGRDGEICFRDFVLDVKGDAFKFVQIMFNLNFGQALNKIACDFNLDNHFDVVQVGVRQPLKTGSYDKEAILLKLKTRIVLQIRSRFWTFSDFAFWDCFGISFKTLNFFNVKPLEYYSINDSIIKADQYAYGFKEIKDRILSYKIYQPFNIDFKWLNSHDEDVVQGWTQLPSKGELLIITKSLKDVMALYENTGIPAIALQSENIKFSDKVLDELRLRFKKIIILYDNDYDKEINWGLKFGKIMSENTGFPFIYIPELFKSKDFSDLIKLHGVEKSVKIILKLIS